MKYIFISCGILGLTAGLYFFITSVIDMTAEKTAKEIKKLMTEHK